MDELKIVEYLNQKCYQMYGGKHFQVTHTAIMSDQTLFNQFVIGATESSIEVDIIEAVHQTLLNKVCNARCNEFLRSIGKLSCTQ